VWPRLYSEGGRVPLGPRKPATEEAGLCLLPGQSTFRCPGHPSWAFHVERGNMGPPMPANQLSSGRDWQPAMTPKTLRHNTPICANMRRNFHIKPIVGGLSQRLPSGSREGYVDKFPYN
jgi:hypothetical protein